LVHDIAHYLLADPYRRSVPEFGLGKGPDACKDAPELIGEPVLSAEEGLSSALGIIWEAELGILFPETLMDHSWCSLEDFEKALKDLENTPWVRNGCPVFRESAQWTKSTSCSTEGSVTHGKSSSTPAPKYRSLVIGLGNVARNRSPC
jgi:hypothetical protein